MTTNIKMWTYSTWKNEIIWALHKVGVTSFQNSLENRNKVTFPPSSNCIVQIVNRNEFIILICAFHRFHIVSQLTFVHHSLYLTVCILPAAARVVSYRRITYAHTHHRPCNPFSFTLAFVLTNIDTFLYILDCFYLRHFFFSPVQRVRGYIVCLTLISLLFILKMPDMEYCVFRSQWKFAVPYACIYKAQRVVFSTSFQSLFSAFLFNRAIVLFFFPCPLFWISVLFIISTYFPVYSTFNTFHSVQYEKRTKKDRIRSGGRWGRKWVNGWASERASKWKMDLNEKRVLSISEMSKHQLKYFYLKKRENAAFCWSHMIRLSFFRFRTNLLLPQHVCVCVSNGAGVIFECKWLLVTLNGDERMHRAHVD